MTNYHRLSIAAKQALQRDRARESPIACPTCETQTMPADLLEHVESRCAGPREPTQHSQWISWRQARDLGVPKANLSFWVNRGYVRSRGEVQSREYLLRDVAMRVAQLHHRRRKFNILNRPSGFWRKR